MVKPSRPLSASNRKQRRALPNWDPCPPCVPASLAGRAVLSPAGKFEAGSYQTFVLTYTAGLYGMDDSSSIKVVFRFATDQSKPQLTDPTAPNYTALSTSTGLVPECRYDVKQNVRPWDQTLYIKIIGGYLAEGDTVTITFGDRSGGSPGMRIQTYAEPFFEFRVLVDPFATYQFAPLQEQPNIEIVAGPPVRWAAVLPTLRRTGEAFSLKLRAEDKWGNVSDQADQILHLRPSRPVDNLPEHVTFPRGQASVVVDRLAIREPGDLLIEVLPDVNDVRRHGASRALPLATSNMLRIVPAETTREVHFWGDLHAQSAETVGTNSARSYFEFGRDLAFVDVIGHQANDFQITQRFWRQLAELTAEFNKDGKFVTLPGYEWSGNTSLGGDRNVFFTAEGRPIRRSSHALVPNRSDANTDCPTAMKLFEALKADGEDVVCFAHVGGRYADIKLAHDVQIERSVEVHSSWGTFEWLLHDAFEMGYRVGIVADSDDHKGRPGRSSPGASANGTYGGLTCLVMPELTRKAVFECLRKRRHYATTGSRPFLSVTAHSGRNGLSFAEDPVLGSVASESTRTFQMGDIASVEDGKVTLRIEFASSSPIERVEIRNGLEILEVVRPYATEEPGSRIRVIWSGAEYRGRRAQTTWDGTAMLEGNEFGEVASINFFNLDKKLDRLNERHLAWRSLTMGNFSGFEARLANPHTGRLSIRTPLVECDVPVTDIGYQDQVFEAGGLARKLKIFRLPDVNRHLTQILEREITLRRNEDSPLYVCITTEDGHKAWSSPIYFITAETEAISKI